MADLSANTASLSVAAASSAEVAGSVSCVDVGDGDNGQPSHTGAAAIRASVAVARCVQSTRGAQHATDLEFASSVYTRVDEAASDAIGRTI